MMVYLYNRLRFRGWDNFIIRNPTTSLSFYIAIFFGLLIYNLVAVNRSLSFTRRESEGVNAV